jgi:hypothetical protein
MKESDAIICREMIIGRNKISFRNLTGGNRGNGEEKSAASTFRESVKFDEGNHKCCY